VVAAVDIHLVVVRILEKIDTLPVMALRYSFHIQRTIERPPEMACHNMGNSFPHPFNPYSFPSFIGNE
jgi:hypothetical protein